MKVMETQSTTRRKRKIGNRLWNEPIFFFVVVTGFLFIGSLLYILLFFPTLENPTINTRTDILIPGARINTGDVTTNVEKNLRTSIQNNNENEKNNNNNVKLIEEEEKEEESLFPNEYLGSSILDSPKGGMRFIEWKDGETPFVITQKLKHESDEIARIRRERIKDAMIHAWEGYKTHAFGHDEVKPVSGGYTSHWGGLGVTLVDALDTLWLMGLKDQFYEARDWVHDNMNFDISVDVSVFETTIRSLGGLLSAYSWSRDETFLNKAKDIGSRLFKAFPAKDDDDRLGLPYGQVNLKTGLGSGQQWLHSKMILSEVGSLQIEFRDLASVAGNEEYSNRSERVFDLLIKNQPSDGLFPTLLEVQDKKLYASNNVSFGAFGDSLYEYELKLWLQGGKKETKYREMYDKSIDGMHSKLLKKSSSGLWYIDSQGGKFEHLTCFMGGLLALGAYTDPDGIDSDRAKRDLQTAKKLAYTCYQLYAQTSTGLAGDEVLMSSPSGIRVSKNDYGLRPETVESLFVLNQLTGDPIYRTWGWEIFAAIENNCKTAIAYGKYANVDKIGLSPEDTMESFFMGETMKYLFLLHDPDTEIDILDKHVFNTEAHPLRVFA